MNATSIRRKAILYQSIFFCAAAVLVLTGLALVLFIGSQGLALFKVQSPADFFLGTTWNQNTGEYGVIPLVYGSLMTTLLTLLVSVPLAILVAIFMVEIAPAPIRRVMRSTVELFAALPSVIFGLLGLTIIVPLVRQVFHAPLGKGILPAAIVLIFMVQPTIVTITEDAIRTAAGSLREASLAVGATRWQMLSGVIIPASRQGILTAVILGLGQRRGRNDGGANGHRQHHDPHPAQPRLGCNHNAFDDRDAVARGGRSCPAQRSDHGRFSVANHRLRPDRAGSYYH